MHATDGLRTGPAHPLARRMALLAFLSHNLTTSTIFGSFGVLLIAIDERLGVGRDISTLAIPPVTIGVSLLAPVIGVLVGRFSLRLLMMIGSALGAAGFAVLGATHSVPFYFLAYALFIAPAMCVCGVVLPGTLVTRLYAVNPWLVLGAVHLPIMLVAAPLVCAFVLKAYGLTFVYFMLSALMSLNFIAQAFAVDFPPSAADPFGEDTKVEAALQPSLTAGEILRQPRFWAMGLAFAALSGGTIMLNSHIAAMAIGWGIDTTRAASLVSMSAGGAICGSLLFGWLADKLGGAATLLIMCLTCIVLWSGLLLQPSFAVLAIIVFLCGLHATGGIPAFGTAITDSFGQGSFARAFGLGNMIGLPLTTFAVPVAAKIYVETGSYSPAILLQMAVFGSAGLLVLLFAVRRGRSTVTARGAVA